MKIWLLEASCKNLTPDSALITYRQRQEKYNLTFTFFFFELQDQKVFSLRKPETCKSELKINENVKILHTLTDYFEAQWKSHMYSAK